MKYWLFQFLWLIAILPKMVQLPILGLIVLGLYVKERNGRTLKLDLRSDNYFTLLLVCTALHGCSIIVNGLSEGYELARILAACNTFGITCIALAFYHFYSTAELEMEKIEKYMFINMNILFGLSLLYWVVGEKGNLPIIGAISGWDQVTGGANAGNVDTTRFLGYLEYSNLVAFMYLFCFSFSVSYLSKRVPALVSVALELMYLLPVFASRSRTGIAVALAMTAVSLLLTKIDRITRFYLKNKAKCWMVGIALLAVICIIFCKPISAVLTGALNYRSGSNDTRAMIYRQSMEKMFTESPIWGCGIKAIIPGIGHPYGSHSTYLGMFYKTGLLGGAIYLAATAIAVIGLIRRKEHTKLDILMTFTFLAVFALAALEDLDGANWNIVMFMSLMAICIRHKTIPEGSVQGE